jgi:hypothetical protein
MRGKLFLVLIILSANFNLIAQSLPGFSYQAVARDANGEPFSNHEISVLFSLLDGSDSDDKILLYQESQQVQTNDYGLFSAEVGKGNRILGIFDEIDWSNPQIYLQIHIDLSGSQGFTLMGSSKVLPIPIAYYALNAGNTLGDGDSDSTNEIQMLSYDTLTNILDLSDGGSVNLSGLIDSFSSPWTVNEEYIVYPYGSLRADEVFGIMNDSLSYKLDSSGLTINEGTIIMKGASGNEYLNIGGSDSTEGIITTKGHNGTLNAFFGRAALGYNAGGMYLFDTLGNISIGATATEYGGSLFLFRENNDDGLAIYPDFLNSNRFSMELNDGEFSILNNGNNKLKLWNDESVGKMALYGGNNLPFFEVQTDGNANDSNNGQLKLYDETGSTAFEVTSSAQGGNLLIRNTTSDAGLYAEQIGGGRMEITVEGSDLVTNYGDIALKRGNSVRALVRADNITTNLFLMGRGGNPMVIMGSFLGLPEDYGLIGTHDSDGFFKSILGGNENGGILDLYGANSTLRAKIKVNGNNTAQQYLYNDSGEKIFYAGDGLQRGGEVIIYDDNGVEKAGIYIKSEGESAVFADVKNFKVAHPEDNGKEIWYASIEGPEAAIYHRGEGTLNEGEIFVEFPETFKMLADLGSLTIQLTPQSAASKGLAVIEKNSYGFRVKELFEGKGNYSFYWEIKANREAFKDYQVIRPKRMDQRN